MQEILDAIVNFFKGDGLTVARTVSVLIFGLLLVQLLMRAVKSGLVRAKVERTVSSFLSSIIGVALYFLLFLLVGKSAGISTASYVALVSAAGLAVSLALKDSLSNLANGFIIVGSKPFVAGDYVDVAGASGTVKSIGIFNTKLLSVDNKLITIPNSQVVGSTVTNYSTTPTRRLDLDFKIAYDADVELTKRVAAKYISSLPQVLNIPAPAVVLTAYGDSALCMSARVWVPNEVYWDVKFAANEGLLKALGEAGILVPFSKIDINVISREGGVN